MPEEEGPSQRLLGPCPGKVSGLSFLTGAFVQCVTEKCSSWLDMLPSQRTAAMLDGDDTAVLACGRGQ